jgi:DNA polymerase-1
MSAQDSGGGDTITPRIAHAGVSSPHLVSTTAEVQAGVENLLQRDAFVVDVETDGRHPVVNTVTWVGLAADGVRLLIPMGHPNGSLVKEATTMKVDDLTTVRPYKNDPTKFTKPKKKTVHVPAEFTDPPDQLTPEEVYPLLEPLFFADNDRAVVGHNVKYDIMSMTKYFGRVPTARTVDTMILQHLLDENKSSYSLKDLTCEWALGKAAMNPAVRKAYYPELGKGGINNFSVEDVAQYLAKDISYTWWMYKRLIPRISREGLEAALDLEMQVSNVLTHMELTGVRVDIQALRDLQKEMHDLIESTEQDMWREAGRVFELKPNDKVAVFFSPKDEGGQGLKPLSFTPKTNKPQVDKRFLEHYRDKNKLVGLMADHTEYVKLTSTFVDKFLETEGLIIDSRVHGSFHQHRAETGRFTSSDPNLQQIPARTELGRSFRKVFVPTPGYKMFVADYSQIELRCAAALSGDKELTRVLINNDDLHTEAAAAAFNVAPEDVTSEQRAVGKTMNFLILYGGGAKRLAGQIGSSKKEAQQMIDNYFAKYTGLPKWRDAVVQQAWDVGVQSGMPTSFIPPYGRRRRVRDLFSSDQLDVWSAQRQLVNSVVQGFAANIMKMALVDVHELLKDTSGRLMLTVHDEIVGEAREDEIDKVFSLVLEGMSGVKGPDGEPILGKIPLVAEGGIGMNWVEAK